MLIAVTHQEQLRARSDDPRIPGLPPVEVEDAIAANMELIVDYPEEKGYAFLALPAGGSNCIPRPPTTARRTVTSGLPGSRDARRPEFYRAPGPVHPPSQYEP